ncbi:MAG: choice-of-anchor B family protein [Candidatus Promineifilaceae bacterium]
MAIILLPLLFALALLTALLSGSRHALTAAPVTENSGPIPCENGFAGPYPCRNVDLVSSLTLSDMGGSPDTKGNDLWGWTDPQTSEEFVLMGLSDGTAFVNISDPEDPRYLDLLPTHTISSTWRDIKIYNNYAYIVADRSSLHGMQVFELTQLRTITVPTTFSETAYYDQFGNGHNLFINEDTGFAYVFRTETCSGAFHMIDLQDPVNPTFAGCFNDDGLTSDTQCVVYSGPDADYQGRKICFTGSDDAFTIGDLTDKNAPVQIDLLTYSNISRAHQESLTEVQSYFLLSDTLDEVNLGNDTRTYLWDVADLDNVIYMGFYEHATSAIDHNIYVAGDFAYQSNFRAGLRILDIRDIGGGSVEEVAYFDVDPDSDSPVKTGAWSNFPWFESGVIAVSDTEQGLFILQPDLIQDPTDVSLSDIQVISEAPGWQPIMLLSVNVVLALVVIWRRRINRPVSKRD